MTKEQAAKALDDFGYVTDIGQLDVQAKRFLNYLAIRGVVEKSQTHQFPLPKTTWHYPR
jgi:hypothetical protein